MAPKNPMIRTVALILALCAWCAPSAVSALSLGQIHPHSALNQNFRADIDLFAIRADDVPRLKASLASADQFAKAGLERPYWLTSFRFRPELRPDGSAVIRAYSHEPIQEPYVEFLIEVTWPGGKLLRQFSVLLDLPAN